MSDNYKGDKFFTIENGKRVATPLLLVLAVVELSDVVFAVDSIPAVSVQCCQCHDFFLDAHQHMSQLVSAQMDMA